MVSSSHARCIAEIVAIARLEAPWAAVLPADEVSGVVVAEEALPGVALDGGAGLGFDVVVVAEPEGGGFPLADEELPVPWQEGACAGGGPLPLKTAIPEASGTTRYPSPADRLSNGS